MEEPLITTIEEKVPFVGDHRFGIMISVSIVISLVFVFVSMALYNSSGAAQLDLSRPGYNDVRGGVDKTDNYASYSSVGPMDFEVFSDFKAVYIEKTNRVASADAFSGDPLSPVALGFEVFLED